MIVMGGVLGGLSAFAFAGWEAGVVRALGLWLPQGASAQGVLTLYAAVGVVLGGAAGGLGQRGGAWMLTVAGGATGYLLAGKVGAAASEAGVWGGVALILAPAGLGLGLVLARLVRSEAVQAGVASVIFVGLAVGLPLNLHALSTPFSSGSLVVDALVLAGAAAVGALVTAVGFVRPVGAVVPIILASAAGWGAYQRVADRPRAEVPVATGDGPPVLLIVVDTLRPDRLGAYGGRRGVSPNLDRLAAGSLRYTDAHSTSSWTLPAMGSLMTGRVPSWHGAGVNSGWANSRAPLRTDVSTLAEGLTAAGYTSAMVTTNPWTSSNFGFSRGFTWFDDRIAETALPVGVHPLRVAGLDPLRTPEIRTAEQVTDAALAFRAEQPARGWFLVVHYMDVHGPLAPLAEDVSALGPSPDGALVSAYDAALRGVDRQIGRLLLSMPSDAWIVVTSDHGEELTESRRRVSGAPVGTRHGHTMFEELLRIPLIVRRPGLEAATEESPVSITDITPTLLAALAPEQVPPEWRSGDRTHADGEPLVAVVGGRANPDRVFVAEGVRFGREQRAAWAGGRKVIDVVGDGYRLYDLAQDPHEEAPVALTTPELTERARYLLSQLPRVGAAAAGHPAPVSAEVRALLRRLGYVDP